MVCRRSADTVEFIQIAYSVDGAAGGFLDLARHVCAVRFDCVGDIVCSDLAGTMEGRKVRQGGTVYSWNSLLADVRLSEAFVLHTAVYAFGISSVGVGCACNFPVGVWSVDARSADAISGKD